jgi:hypothetical protein
MGSGEWDLGDGWDEGDGQDKILTIFNYKG